MSKTPVEAVLEYISYASELHYRLIILVGPPGSGKTAVLQDLHGRTGAPIINVNLELSRRMLDLTERNRVLHLRSLLEEIVVTSEAHVVLLHNIELLFDVSLKQDPLRLLQMLSRNRTVVAAWSGSIDGKRMVYATPGHPEYRRYPLEDFLVVNLGAGA